MIDLSTVRDIIPTIGDTGALEVYAQNQLERILRNPLMYGDRPHVGQERILACPGRRRIVVAGNRFGKTTCGIRDVLWCARGEHPYRKIKAHRTIWVGAPDYPSYLRYHRPAFDEWCPPDWIVGDFNETEKRVDIRRVDGRKCRISFLSYDMPRSKWQGAGVDGIWLDEECPEDIVKECLARIVTTRGWIMLTFTAVSGIGWWHDRLFLPAMEGRSSWWAFQAALATFDAANEVEFNVGRPLVPHLSREQIVEFASEYPDPDERAIRIFGEVKGRTGLVYKGLRREIHVIEPFALPPFFELWGGLDPGYHGFAAVIAAFDAQNRIFIVREFFSQQESTSERFRRLAEEVRGLRTEEEWHAAGPTTVVFFVDTEDPQVILELNIQAQAAAERDARAHPDQVPVTLAFASLDQGLKARKAGFLRVQQALAPLEHRITPPLVTRPRPPAGEPQVYFFDDLYSEWQEETGYHRESRLLWELERYAWKKPPRGSTVQPDDADENSAGGAHACASLRYLTMARLGPPEEPEPNPREGLDPMAAAVWEDVEELDRRQLEQAGLV